MSHEFSISHSDALGGFNVLSSRAIDFEYAPHSHSEVVIASCTAGTKIATCDKQRLFIQAGDILVLGPETLHRASTSDEGGWQYQSVYLATQQIADATGLTLVDVENRVAGHRLHRGFKALGCRLQHALTDGPDQPYSLTEFLVELLSKSGKKEARALTISASVRDVYERLTDDPPSATTLGALARLAAMSPEHLSRQFKAAYGISPFQYLTFCGRS